LINQTLVLFNYLVSLWSKAHITLDFSAISSDKRKKDVDSTGSEN